MSMNMGSWSSRSVATLVVATDGTGDYTNIQDALDALPVTGGCIYIKEGTYTITASINVTKDNTSLIGCGNSTRIQTTTNITMINVTANNGIHINKLFLYGDITKAVNDGIYFNDVDNGTIRDVKIENCGRHGIKTNIGSYDLITGCLIWKNNNCGVWMYNGDTYTFEECYISDNGDSGIFTDVTQAITISNSMIGFNGNYGVYLSNGNGTIVSGNVISGNDYDGIRLNTFHIGVISSNLIEFNDWLDTATYSGVILISSDDCVISSNNINYNDNFGIDISNAACDKNIVLGNRCKNNTAGGINNIGTLTQIAHNIV